MKPILIIFASNIAIMIYVYSDTTMLGFMQTDYEVGIYSVSVKIYNIVKNLLSAVLIVSIPRLSMYYGSGKIKEFESTAQKVYDSITALVMPAVIGLLCVSKQVVLVISGEAYISAQSSLRILCIALLFCIYGWFFSQCVLMPAQKEKTILIATCVSAAVNIGLNFYLIPIWKENAAAFTTFVSEFIMFFVCVKYGLKIVRIKLLNKNMIGVLTGCVGIVCVCRVALSFNYGAAIQLISAVVVSGIVYGLILILFRNEIAWTILRKVCRTHEK